MKNQDTKRGMEKGTRLKYRTWHSSEKSKLRGATAVQIAYKVESRIVKINHIGSAHNEEELQILLEIARKQLQADQLE